MKSRSRQPRQSNYYRYAQEYKITSANRAFWFSLIPDWPLLSWENIYLNINLNFLCVTERRGGNNWLIHAKEDVIYACLQFYVPWKVVESSFVEWLYIPRHKNEYPRFERQTKKKKLLMSHANMGRAAQMNTYQRQSRFKTWQKFSVWPNNACAVRKSWPGAESLLRNLKWGHILTSFLFFILVRPVSAPRALHMARDEELNGVEIYVDEEIENKLSEVTFRVEQKKKKKKKRVTRSPLLMTLQNREISLHQNQSVFLI